MHCPNCGNEMKERERSGITIDFCPVCKGVWLDRGELDKLIERERESLEDDDEDYARARAEYDRERGRSQYDREPTRREYERERGREEYAARPPHKKKRSSFFESLTDVFGGGGMED